MRSVMRGKLCRRSNPIFLELLRKLPGDADWTFREMRRADIERFDEPVGRFKEDRRLFPCVRRQQLSFTLSAFHWQKPAVIKAFRWKTAPDQSRQHRAW